MDTASLLTASSHRLEKLEHEIDLLFPFETLRGKADRVLRDALATYANEVWSLANQLPALENRDTLIKPAQALAPYPVFILGVHRSGTTLMQRLLDNHPALSVLPSEGTYLTNFYPRLRRLDEAGRLAYLVQRWIPRLINPGNQPPYWTLGRTQESKAPYLTVARNALYLASHARSCFDRHPPFQPHLALVMAVEGARQNKQVDVLPTFWVDKTPLNEFHVATLRTAFPNAKFIHMVRDPRAVFASRKKLSFAILGTPGRPLRLLHEISRSFRAALQNQRRLGEATYHLVRYEDLLHDLSGRMASVRTFLGIDDHETLTQPTASGVPCVANSSYTHPFVAGRVENHSERHFEQILTPLESDLIAGFTGRCAHRLGYPLKPPGPFSCGVVAARYVMAQMRPSRADR